MARVSGMVSGLDTDSLIEELVSAYSKKKETYEKKQTKLSWTQDTWKSLNTKVYSYYTGSLNTSRFSSAYTSKKATISDSTKATVTASSSAVTGTQTFRVNKLAKTAYLTGAEIGKSGGSKLTGSDKLSDIEGIGDVSNGSIKVTVDGVEKEISVNADTTISSFVTSLKSAGLNANFDATNQRLFVSATSSGADHEFSITASNAGGLSALNGLGLNATSASDITSYQEKAAINVEESTDTDYVNYVLKEANTQLNSQLTELQSQYSYVTDESAREKQDAAWASQIESYQTKIDTATTNISELLAWTNKGEDDTTDGPALSTYLTEKDDGTYELNAVYMKSDDEGNQVLDEDALKTALETQGAKFDVDTLKSKLEELNTNISTKSSNETEKTALEAKQAEYQGLLTTDNDGSNLKSQIEAIQAEISENENLMNDTYDFTSTTTDLSGLKNKLNDYAVKYFGADANTATDSNGLILSDSLQSVYDGYQTAYTNERETAQATLDELTQTALDASDLSDDEKAALTDEEKTKILNDYAANNGFNGSGKGAVRVAGSDAEIVLNGATFTATTNNFSINGLTITATAEMDPDEEITISTTTDIDGIYDSIKKMLSDYNDVLKEMNNLYYADSSSGYEPLTDDEKDAMTDTEIEKWETKIKDSLLRRDSTLGNIMTAMKNSMAKTYTINGKMYSLSSFGISTISYFSASEEDRGTYHIDGDPDDSNSSGNTDKLRAALANDPDTVISFFQQVADDLYSTLTKKMAATSLSSAYTIYNDKQMQTQYDEYDDTIDDWDDKIDTYTERYVKQFSAMETALSKLNSNSSYISSMLG